MCKFMCKTFGVISVKIAKQKWQVPAALHSMPEVDLETFYLDLVRDLPELFCLRRVSL